MERRQGGKREKGKGGAKNFLAILPSCPLSFRLRVNVTLVNYAFNIFMSGIYHLLIQLLQPQEIIVGKLGLFRFPSGYYVYTGSALNGLEARVARHRRKEKRLHWHIDYLLQQAKIIDVVFHPNTEEDKNFHITTARLECEYNRRIMNLPDAQIIVPRFGASDCKCDAHLVYFPNRPVLG